ncbi:MAG: hypothetical protein A2172_00075 [Candidatus Woykebacteria bacterium RBG_13_40_15]|uniref:SHOCT domain-containing protein n=1 Tax=Candidatus Woykebacteria bacterium RBG_13_40_15 TaxID=1802593 RepID=A0A1G1W7S5_9BACT|nr:MAG: hypothetical protein A2172_00075 [Candidatus Woykebacteria bacterium RBG_13_40_15]
MEQNLDDLAKLSELKEKGIITEEEFQQKKEQLLQLSPNQADKPQQPEEKTVKGEKWYKKPLGIIALLILFFPAGLFLMWKYTDWHKNIKWGITGFFALIVIWSIVSSALAKTPVITLNDFEADKTVTGSEYSLSGKVDPPSSELKINGKTVEVKEDGSFTYSLSLEEGVNEIKIEANNSGKTAELSRKLTRELTEEEKAAKAAEEKRKAEEETKQKAEEEKPDVPAEYKSALAQATTYANDLHLSKKGVYDQLVSEYGGQFKAEAAQYAIDNVKADWKANALAKAKTYQNDLHLSPSAIRDQLVSEYGEKFTAAEADYAIQHLND